MRTTILMGLIFWGVCAQAFDVSEMVGSFEGPNGCSVEVLHWNELGENEVGVILRTQAKGYPAAFVLSQNNLFDDGSGLGFLDQPVGFGEGLVQYKASLQLYLNSKKQPRNLIYTIWKEIKGVKVPFSKEEHFCLEMESTELNSL
jgi:hypothetical protein